MKELRFAIKNTIPVFFTYVFIGIAFGILMKEAGYGPVLSAVSALFIYAGSMQLIMVPMMASGSSLVSLAVMTFFVNARHIFYGIGFVEKYRRMGWKAPYMIMTLTDETYSILSSISFEAGLDEDRASLYISMLDHSYWILGCILGSCAGTYLNFDMRGIDFAATAFFLIVVVNQWHQQKSKLPFIAAAGCSALCFMLLGADRFLIPAIVSCLLVLIVLKRPIESKEALRDE